MYVLNKYFGKRPRNNLINSNINIKRFFCCVFHTTRGHNSHTQSGVLSFYICIYHSNSSFIKNIFKEIERERDRERERERERERDRKKEREINYVNISFMMI